MGKVLVCVHAVTIQHRGRATRSIDHGMEEENDDRKITRFRVELDADGLGRKTIKNSVRTMF